MIIFIGLIVSGTLLVFSFVTGRSEWEPLGIFLGWIFSVLSMFVYVVTLTLAIYRNNAEQFWCDWSPLNFGLTLFAYALIFTQTKEMFVLAWASLLGVGISIALYRWRGIGSRYILILVNVVLLAPTLSFLSHYWEFFILAIATVFVIVPAIYSVGRGIEQRGTKGPVYTIDREG